VRSAATRSAKQATRIKSSAKNFFENWSVDREATCIKEGITGCSCICQWDYNKKDKCPKDGNSAPDCKKQSDYATNGKCRYFSYQWNNAVEAVAKRLGIAIIIIIVVVVVIFIAIIICAYFCCCRKPANITVVTGTPGAPGAPGPPSAGVRLFHFKLPCCCCHQNFCLSICDCNVAGPTHVLPEATHSDYGKCFTQSAVARTHVVPDWLPVPFCVCQCWYA